ncbi:MAG: hypothetical protein J5824_04690 [Lachnospiraceae bacterium]|nr:hypothetical protein [Lachnospiraceae bacterium]
MELLKRIISVLLVLCMTAGCFAFTETEKAEAGGLSTIDGTIYVYHLDNTFSNGKYQIREQIVHNRTDTNYDIYVYISDQYLANSAGKKVLTWKNWKILPRGGSKTINYGVDFSSLPSGTYTLHFGFSFGNSYADCSRKITHSAGKISYLSSKYIYDTNGNKSLNVKFNLVSLKGYAPKFEVFNNKGKRIYSRTCNKVAYSSSNYNFTWDFSTDSGYTAGSGTYTFKVTCNGKSCSKNLTIKN